MYFRIYVFFDEERRKDLRIGHQYAGYPHPRSPCCVKLFTGCYSLRGFDLLGAFVSFCSCAIIWIVLRWQFRFLALRRELVEDAMAKEC